MQLRVEAEVFVVESIEDFLLDETAELLKEKFFMDVKHVRAIRAVYEGLRYSQFLADAQLARILAEKERDAFAVGVTGLDLYSNGLNFVFGIALPFKGCVVSSARLRTFDEKLLRLRWRKEVTHEMGHVFGLSHCPDPECVMHFSNSLADTDRKSENFCFSCLEKLNRVLEELSF